MSPKTNSGRVVKPPPPDADMFPLLSDSSNDSDYNPDEEEEDEEDEEQSDSGCEDGDSDAEEGRQKKRLKKEPVDADEPAPGAPDCED